MIQGMPPKKNTSKSQNPTPLPPALAQAVQASRAALSRGDLAGADRLLASVKARVPAHPDVLATSVDVAMARGDADGALAPATMARDLGHEGSHARLARVLVAMGSIDDAIGVLTPEAERSIQGAHDLLMLQLHTDRLVEAIATTRHMLDLDPANIAAMHARASATLKLGRAEEALGHIREAVDADPNSVPLAQLHAFITNYVPSMTPKDVRDAHTRFGTLLAQGQPPMRPAHPRPDTPRRLGFLSADFFEHSVSYFLLPLLEGLDKDRFDIVLLSITRRHDATTLRFRELATEWVDLSRLPTEQALSMIHAARIDVLVDISGLTAGSRPDLLAQAPAHHCLSYLGYPASTGISRVHARIGDSITDPPGTDDRVLRLDPCFLTYQPPRNIPIARRERAPGDGITFGSFNALAKTNDEVLAVWARVLNAVPNSRLVLKNPGLRQASCRVDVSNRLIRAGLDPSRVDLLPPAPTVREHLDTYSRIDIALDTFPYAGTTTTCEALLMGVPVITLAGDRHAGRVGASIGADEPGRIFVTHSPDTVVHCVTRILSGERLVLHRDQPTHSSNAQTQHPSHVHYATTWIEQVRHSWLDDPA